MTETLNAFRTKQEKKDRGARVLKCAFCRHVTDMPAELKAQLIEVWGERDVSSATIAEQLTDWGVKTSTSVVSSHRSGARVLCDGHIATQWALEL